MEDSEPTPSRFVVGIDLGTTNCAVCYADTEIESGTEAGDGLANATIFPFRVPQWVDFGQAESLETLPSFHYEWTTEESADDPRLPWQSESAQACVGVLARDAGNRRPGRRAASAKSWLSHGSVDRTADLLPWHGDADVERLSPVVVSSRYLRHIRDAWNHAHPQHPLEQQDVVITLPASFDEVARELTVSAAKRAGLPRVFLIEEPQAAFYAWIDRQGDDWQRRVAAGQLILVCDIGGGTTDLTLIRVRTAGESESQVQFHRVAVGSHLILGGDNLDLAIARLAELKLAESKLAESKRDESGSDHQTLSASQWDRLVQVSRSVKETMLSDQRPETYTIHLPAEGSRLVGGGIQIELTAAEIDRVLLDGFFPKVELADRPESGQSGFQEFGLPYAADPAVTRHLAEFLNHHRYTGADQDDSDAADRPDLVLFNGGVMASPSVGRRVVECLGEWFSKEAEDWIPEVLESPRLDLAVAHGAAYYGLVRRGQGVRIAANLGHSYYLQVESHPPRGLCLIPGSAEAGQRFRADDHPLKLTVGTPVQFPLWTSSTRLADPVGEVIDIDRNEATPLPPICTALMDRRRSDSGVLNVVVESELSEIGTVGLFCVDTDTDKRWKLDFDIRSTLETDRDAHQGSGESSGIIDDETVLQCEQVIASVFDRDHDSAAQEKPSKIVKRLQTATDTNRADWPPSLLRQFWQSLVDQSEGRRISPQHEARWLNLLGYSLRPGYGVAVDDWRVATTWRTLHSKMVFPAASTRTESMILWRRIAGGLTAGQQVQLAAPWLAAIRGKGWRQESHEATEVWRLVGSLERLSPSDKITFGREAFTAIGRRKNDSIRPVLVWTIGRLGSRQPVYGPLNATVPVGEVDDWCEQLMAMIGTDKVSSSDPVAALSLAQLARKTGDRFRDLGEEQRNRVAKKLAEMDASDSLVHLVQTGGRLPSEEEAAIFGDTLPLGIQLQR